ncbi:unnamed protein product [Phyllotreta striolata]|uniref:Voltage-dependent calcium channel gamma-5 subunit n=1 Tax=Phyllotreta striolata TaxID=444603 RepID=A0A9P0GTY5_PHYSR|nr:unnamed protein product [Phyllotreta striolata]
MQRPLSRAAASEEEASVLNTLEATLSCLWILTPLSATLSLVLVVTGLGTNQWLHTSEKMPNPAYNGTGEKEYLPKLTVSGLWTFCYTNPGESTYQCSPIEYFSEEAYSPDPNDSTLAIPYAVSKSIVFIFMGSAFVVIGYIICILGQCLNTTAKFTLISGIIFIQTGLAMLCGLIMYIAVFKSEVGSKLRPRSQIQPASFDYFYGFSFITYVTGVVCTKFTGVFCVFLFINKTQYDWKRKWIIEAPPVVETYSNYKEQQRAANPCRMHPDAYVDSNNTVLYPIITNHNHINAVSYPSSHSKTLPCNVHAASQSNSNSLKDVSYFPDVFSPSSISYRFPHHLSTNNIDKFSTFQREASAFPRDPTTNTVSTTADVVCEYAEDYSPTMHEQEFARFDLDQPFDLRQAPSVASLSYKERLSCQSDTLRRTTPV